MITPDGGGGAYGACFFLKASASAFMRLFTKKRAIIFSPMILFWGSRRFLRTPPLRKKRRGVSKCPTPIRSASHRAHGEKGKIKSYLSLREVRRVLYRWGQESFSDRVFLAWAADPKEANVVRWRALLAMGGELGKAAFSADGRHGQARGRRGGRGSGARSQRSGRLVGRRRFSRRYVFHP